LRNYLKNEEMISDFRISITKKIERDLNPFSERVLLFYYTLLNFNLWLITRDLVKQKLVFDKMYECYANLMTLIKPF
jgi:hypothetical protein